MPPIELDYRSRELSHFVNSTDCNWYEIIVRMRQFKKIDPDHFVVEAFSLTGQDTLLFLCDSATPSEVAWDYFPISIEAVEVARVRTNDWFVLASAGSSTGLSGRLRWLFDKPSMRLIETEEIIGTNRGRPEEQEFRLRFYRGVELVSATGLQRIQFMVSDQAEFNMRMTILGC